MSIYGYGTCFLCVCALLSACTGESEKATGQPVSAAESSVAGTSDSDWPLHGNDFGETRFSPLDQVNKSNVDDLGLAWSYDLGSTRGVEATPIVVGGVMYVSAPWSVVHAVNAKTGAPLWVYDPEVDRQHAIYACCDVVNRGVAVADGRVFVGTIDGRLVALDARSGSLLWEVQTTPPDQPYTITGAPRVIKDKVVIGNGGAELLVRGYITAYDTATGTQAWRFYTVPRDPSKPVEHPELESAMATWTGEWWKDGGGGTAWDSMVYDPELNLLYVGVGNGAPWPRYQRSPGGGDNLFLCSILALNPDTGRLVWHYQTTPGDNWDYTSVQPMILADLKINGEERKVLLQAPKNGFFYVLDRASGEFISAQPYTTVNWATHIDPETGRPVEAPVGQYAEKDQIIYPGPLGGHNWQGMAFNPNTGYVYLPAQDVPLLYANDPQWREQPGAWRLGLDGAKLFDAELPEYKGYLIAWDPVAQKAVWRHQFAGYWNGGVLATGGDLVFQGSADGLFTAYDAVSGDRIWQVAGTTGIIAPPTSYAIDGEQYVAVAAGYGGGGINGGIIEGAVINRHLNQGRVLAFKLGGAVPMPASPPRNLTLPEPPQQTASAETIAQGKFLYDHHCWPCHGSNVASSWVVPDLRYLSAERHAIFNDILLKGALLPLGMPSFAAELDDADADAIHAYVIEKAHELKAEQGTLAAAQ